MLANPAQTIASINAWVAARDAAEAAQAVLTKREAELDDRDTEVSKRERAVTGREAAVSNREAVVDVADIEHRNRVADAYKELENAAAALTNSGKQLDLREAAVGAREVAAVDMQVAVDAAAAELAADKKAHEDAVARLRKLVEGV